MIRNLLIALCAAMLLLPACSSSHSSQSFKYKKYKTERGQSHAARGWRTKRNVQKAHPRVGQLPRSDIPLVVNERVVHWIDFWTGRARGSFGRYLKRSGRFMEMMRGTLREKGMPEDLVYIALIESGFRNDARSHAAAVGTWQFIRSTGKMYGLKIGEWIDERQNPELAVEAAANYFADLYEEFGDWYLAMAAYNGGPGRVKQAMRRYKSSDFWELTDDGRNVFRNETKNYVPKYIAATILAKNPERFGFKNIQYDAPLISEQVVVHGQTDLEIIAKAAQVPEKVLRDHNPELRAESTPPGKYTVHLPAGRAYVASKNFKKVAGKHGGRTVKYRVRSGDTLSHIASRYGVTVSKLKSANGLRSSRIGRGKMLRIPGTRMAGSKMEVVGSSVKIAKRREAEASQRRAAAPTTSTAVASSQFHRVQEGERVRHIAKRYGVNTKDLRAWNGLSRFGGVAPGQVLRLRAPHMQQPLVVAKATPQDSDALIQQVEQVRKSKSYEDYKKPTTYKVRRGDVLSVIARKHRVSVGELKKWNSLRGDRIRVGQRLRVSSGSSRVASSTRKKERAAPKSATTYKVRRGDTLSVIARRHGLATADLRAWNNVQGSAIRAGQVLSLRPQGAAQPATDAKYTVRSGDSLGVIARRHGMTVRELQRANQMGRSTRIRAGQTLKVASVVANKPAPQVAPAVDQPTTTPVSQESSAVAVVGPVKPSAAAPSKEVLHTVRSGDTLWDISREYKVSPQQIQQWNDMKSAKIKPGQSLTIRTSS